jgi:acetyl esterase/lipase
MEHEDKVIYQPLHMSIRDKLDPEYVAFHDGVLQYVEPGESQPWDPSSRDMSSPLFTGVQKPVHVGQVFDKAVENIQMRVFVPEGKSPSDGWPCLVWLHGGGWVYGGLASDNGFLRHVCKCKATTFLLTLSTVDVLLICGTGYF